MKRCFVLLILGMLTVCGLGSGSVAEAQTTEEIPQTAIDLWKDVDFRRAPLETQEVEVWSEDGVTCKYVIFDVGTFKGAVSRCAAFYTFPDGMQKGPAFVWAHGGGQRADRERGMYFAKQGYATLDINWGGREIAEGVPFNTEWGKVDPSQGPKFYPSALRKGTKMNLQPDEHTIDSVVSPRNGNWYLLAYAGRRGITFLENQPEVDPEKIGFTGFSMGGNITSMAAIDSRLKAVVPMVGGSGFINDDFPGIPNTGRSRTFKDVELYNRTIDGQAYWPHVKCPVLFLNASDDFHAVFERVFQGANLIPHDNWCTSHLMHYNHSLGPQQWILLNLWFDRYLKGEQVDLPKTVKPSFVVNGETAQFEVTPDRVDEVQKLEIFYSHDPNARSRFWMTATAERNGNAWSAELPVRENLPLYVFANITYPLKEATESFSGTTETFTITSDESVHMPETVDVEQLRAEARHLPVFHDFEKSGVRDWAIAPRGGISTYKFQDPARATPAADMAIRISVNVPREGLSYRLRITKRKYLTGVTGQKEDFGCNRNLEVGQTELILRPSDFTGKEGKQMKDWDEITPLQIGIYDGTAKQTLDYNQAETVKLISRIEWVQP